MPWLWITSCIAVMTARVVSPGHSCAYSSREVASSTTWISVCFSSGTKASQA
jgi:hypothetical protein